MDIDPLAENQQLSRALIQLPNDLSSLNRWLFQTIQPYLKGRVLEMDSGTGVISQFFIENQIPVHLNAIEKKSRDRLRMRFNGTDTIKAVHSIDFMDPEFLQHHHSRLDQFNTLIALNLSENNFCNQIALTNGQLLLRQKGHLIVVEPANTALYQDLEGGLEDWKKYNRKYLKKLLGNKFEIMLIRYFNLMRTMKDSSSLHYGLLALVVARKKEPTVLPEQAITTV